MDLCEDTESAELWPQWAQRECGEEIHNLLDLVLPEKWRAPRATYRRRVALAHYLSQANLHTDNMDKQCILICVRVGGNAKFRVNGEARILQECGVYVFNDFLPHSFSSNYESVLISYGSEGPLKYHWRRGRG